ncbi:hypothetical protein Tco_1278221 [Tanacetum coccineum]
MDVIASFGTVDMDLLVIVTKTTPATAETEGFLSKLGAQVEMQSGAVREETFSQRYRFRSLEYEQERVAVTFGALWRPMERTMICGLQLAEERRARLELVEVLDDMRRGQEPKGDA